MVGDPYREILVNWSLLFLVLTALELKWKFDRENHPSDIAAVSMVRGVSVMVNIHDVSNSTEKIEFTNPLIC